MKGRSGLQAGSSRGVVAGVGRSIVAGTLATMTMDGAMLAAARVGGEALDSERLSPQIIGRWAAGLLRGRYRHDDITLEKPVPGELILGLATHYATGIVLTAGFALLPRRARPGVSDAVVYGVATSALPFLVLFPSLGYGWFGLRSGEAGRMARVMLIGHTAFGAGIGIWTRRLMRS